MTLLKISKIQIVLITVGVLLFGFSCTGMLSHSSIHAPVNPIGVATVIPTDNQRCCNTNISQNIDSLKNAILTTSDKTRNALAFLALGLIPILGYSWISLWNRRLVIDLSVGRSRFYTREHPGLIPFNHLKLAFARGILNPKIY